VVPGRQKRSPGSVNDSGLEPDRMPLTNSPYHYNDAMRHILFNEQLTANNEQPRKTVFTQNHKHANTENPASRRDASFGSKRNIRKTRHPVPYICKMKIYIVFLLN